MSDTKNHKLAIKAIIEAHRTPGKMREILLTILADKPSAIVNAWEEVKPVKIVMELRSVFPEKVRQDEEPITCQGCFCVMNAIELSNNNSCPYCGFKRSVSP